MELTCKAVDQTGQTYKNYKIKINNFEINLNKRLPKFEKYDIINKEERLKLFSNFYLPISVNVSTYNEIEEKEIVYTKEEAKNILVEKLKSELFEEINNDKEILNIIVNTTESENSIEAEVICEVQENIGTEEKIIEK